MKPAVRLVTAALAALFAALPLILLTSLTSYANPIVHNVSGYAYVNSPASGSVFYVDNPDALANVTFSVSASISYKVTTDDQSAWFGLYDWSISLPGSPPSLTGLENSGTVNKNTESGWMVFHKDYEDTVSLGVGLYWVGINSVLIDGLTAQHIPGSAHSDVHYFRVVSTPDSACTALLLGLALAALGGIRWCACRTERRRASSG